MIAHHRMLQATILVRELLLLQFQRTLTGDFQAVVHDIVSFVFKMNAQCQFLPSSRNVLEILKCVMKINKLIGEFLLSCNFALQWTE